MEANLKNLMEAEQVLLKNLERTKQKALELYNALSKCTPPPTEALNALQESINSFPAENDFNLKASFVETLNCVCELLVEYKSNYCEITFCGILIPFTRGEVVEYHILIEEEERQRYINKLYMEKICEAVKL